MAEKVKRRGRAQNSARLAEIQKYVDQDITYQQIGQMLTPKISGERVRQVIAQNGIKGPARKRGRRPRPIETLLTSINVDEFKQMYYGDPQKSSAPVPVATIAKHFNVSTTRVRKILRHLKLGKRASLPRPKRKTPRIYDIALIEDLYVNKRWSDQRIADYLRERHTKAYASYINLLRSKHNIRRDPLKPSERKNAKGDVAAVLKQYLLDGLSPKEIAYKIPCSSSYVYRLIKDHELNHLLPSRRDEGEVVS